MCGAILRRGCRANLTPTLARGSDLLEPSRYCDAGFPIVGCCERGIQFATVGPSEQGGSNIPVGGPTGSRLHEMWNEVIGYAEGGILVFDRIWGSVAGSICRDERES